MNFKTRIWVDSVNLFRSHSMHWKNSKSKSCELDPLLTWLLKECLEELLPFLTYVINESFKKGYVPKSFISYPISSYEIWCSIRVCSWTQILYNVHLTSWDNMRETYIELSFLCRRRSALPIVQTNKYCFSKGLSASCWKLSRRHYFVDEQ